MTNTSEIVWRFIDEDAILRYALQRSILNIRAVARQILGQKSGELNRGVTIDAVISAIRRYPLRERSLTHSNIASMLAKLTMRNRIVDIDIKNSPDIPAALGRIASQMDYSRGDAFRILVGVESIKVLVDERNLSKFDFIPKSNIKGIVRNLSEIIVSMPKVAATTPGIVAAVSGELMIERINLVEFMSCVPELIIVVEEEDALRSYKLIQNLAKRVNAAPKRGVSELPRVKSA